MSKFPFLTTDRLTLRNFVESDVPAVYAIFSEESVAEFYDIDAFSSLDQAKSMVASRMRRNEKQDGTWFRWAICLSTNPEVVIGSCGFHSTNEDFHSIQIGYELHPQYWGKGIAFEAVSTMLKFCFESHFPFHVNWVAATTDLDSQRSIKLLRRLGFSEEGILRQFGFWKDKFQDVRLFSLLRTEWEAK
ncbi:GNAT family N-acetyltransferase [Hylemonella gracilis]|uniref:GNAT family N-acetyltransferase n=1 Tax=Hylemonella gracilis TaxID=80880 RepID=UPI0018CC28D1|nr:GNAT family N-acetyltransferase [Hylemonella gracilis]